MNEYTLRKEDFPAHLMNDDASLRLGQAFRLVRGEKAPFYFACLYLVFEYVRPQSIYPVLENFPWTACFAVFALLASFLNPSGYSFKHDGIGRIVVLYAGVVLVSSMLSEYPTDSFSKLSTFFSWFLIYFAIVRSVTTSKQYFLFICLYMLCNLKMTQHGFLAWAGRGFAFDSWGVVGGPGWFHNSGEFGIQLSVFAPLAGFFALAVWSRTGRVGRAILVVMPVTAVFCALASSSRGAIIGLFGATIWAARRVRNIIPALALTGALGIVTIAFAPSEFKERFESMGTDKTSMHRLDRWGKGLDTVLKFPVFGVGHEAWVPYYRANLNYGQPGSLLVHNILVQCATELGFTGLGVFCVLIFRMLRTTEAARKQAYASGDHYNQFLAQGLEMATVGMLVSSMFVTVLYYPFIWIQAALVAAFAQSVRQSTQSSNLSSPHLTRAVPYHPMQAASPKGDGQST